MLEVDDIQHFLLTRTPALAARYEFLTFRKSAAGRAWLAGLIDKVGTGKSVGSASPDSRWVTLAFTWNGLRALGVDEVSLETFPEEFRQGMAARAEIIGATGANHPDQWVGELASPALHAVAVLFARDVAERERCKKEHDRYLSRIGDVDVLSGLDLEAIHPGEPREHFGYRDRLSHPVIEGTGEEAPLVAPRNALTPDHFYDRKGPFLSPSASKGPFLGQAGVLIRGYRGLMDTGAAGEDGSGSKA